MAKKHFIRYNPVADRVESFSGKRPKGSSWQELTIDKCCPKVELGTIAPTPTAGKTAQFREWSNGKLTPLEIVSATDSFDITGNTVTLNAGVDFSLVVVKMKERNGLSPDVAYDFNQYFQTEIVDLSDNGDGTWNMTLGCYFSGSDNFQFAINTSVSSPDLVDAYLEWTGFCAHVNNATAKVGINLFHNMTFKLHLPGYVGGAYALNFMLDGSVVHTVSNPLGNADWTFNINATDGLIQYDAITIITLGQPNNKNFISNI
jgi:hypothetical protein